MVRNYKRKTENSWSRDTLNKAIDEFKGSNSSCNDVAKRYNIPEPTLRRYIKKNKEVPKSCNKLFHTYKHLDRVFMNLHIVKYN